MRASLTAGLLSILSATSLSAQAAGALPILAELPASTRAMALGNAFAMSSGHADAIFYHPALLTGASGFGLDVQRWGPEGTSATASGAMGWLGGGVAVGLQNLQFGAATEGAAVAPGGRDHLFDPGIVGVSERIASLGYAREVLGVDVGVVGKVLEERVGRNNDTAGLLDVGVATDVGPLTAGLSWRNLGQAVGSATTSFDRASGPALGVGGYGRQLGPLDVGLAATASYLSGAWAAGGGVEVGYWPIQGRTFVGRVGVQRVPSGGASPFSFGFAYWGDDVTLEWAFRPYDGAPSAGTHRFGVRWR